MVNFDLPNVPETYVHRIGRTARAGAEGIAISLCDGEEVAFLRDIEKLIRMSIPVDRPARGDPRQSEYRARQTGIAPCRRPVCTASDGDSSRRGKPRRRSAPTGQHGITISRRDSRRVGSDPSPSCSATPRRGATQARAARIGPLIRKDRDMAKEELLQFDGLVTEILPDARYRVQLDTGHELVAYTAGRMKKNRIKTLAGDRVTVEMSPYDLEKGRLIFRHKDERAGSVQRPPQRNHFRRR